MTPVSDERPLRLVRLAAVCMAAGMVLVPALLGAAMACFPPGHAGAQNGYVAQRHVVSDLGRTRLSNGTPNVASRVLFAAAMSVTGLATSLFWLARSGFVVRPAARHAARIFGVFGGACLAAIGFLPLDRVPRVHDPVTAATAIGAALAVLAVLTDPDERFEGRRSKRLWLAAMLTVAAAWTLLVAMHHQRLLAFRPWLPVGQKALIGTFTAWLAFQTARLFRWTRGGTA